MKAFFQFVLRSVSAFFATGTTWVVSFFAFGQTFLLSSVYAVIGGVVAYTSIKQLTNYRTRQLNGLSRREYKYITKQLKDAKEKINRLQKAFLNVRSIDQAKQNLDIIRTARKIYSNTKNDPRRFYKAEGFYYKHLDSLVELAEKYAYLSSQPVKSKDIHDSLRDTRITIYQLGESVKKDLTVMLRDDIDTLDFELDVAKHSIKKMKGNNRRLLK